jgi:hypothetical protein
LAWKKEILAVAARHLPASKPVFGVRFLNQLWQEWIAPYPIAYAGIAVAWLLILFFCMATPADPASEQLARNIKASPQLEAQLIAQWDQNRLQRKLGL